MNFIIFLKYILYKFKKKNYNCKCKTYPPTASVLLRNLDYFCIPLKLEDYNDDFLHTLDKCSALVITCQISRLLNKIGQKKRRKEQIMCEKSIQN